MKKITLLLMLLTISLTAFAQTTVTCGSTTNQSGDCYTSSVNLDYSYMSSDSAQVLTITVNAGEVESGWDEFIVYDGEDATATELYNGYGTSGDLTGLTFTTSGPNLFVRIQPDGSADCGTEGYATLDFDVVCATPPSAPDCATNPTPVDGATNQPIGTTTLTWDTPLSGPSPTSYDLFSGQMSDGSDFGLVGNYVTNTANVTVSGFEATIYYQVVPKNGNVSAMGCPIWSLTTIPAPTGALCSDPIVVSSLPYNQTGATTEGFGDDYTSTNVSCSTSSYLNGDDIVYAYTPVADINVDVTLENTGTWAGLFIFSGCENANEVFTECFGNSTSSAAGSRAIEAVDLTGGTTYYIVISTFASPQSTPFDLSITENTCSDATATFTAVEDCANTQFTVDVDITDLGSATSVTISDDQGSSTQQVSNTGIVSFGPYASATNVNFTVINDQDATCEISGSVVFGCPPPNDACVDAEILTLSDTTSCNNLLSGTTQGASTDAANGCSTSGRDVWYRFTSADAGDYFASVTETFESLSSTSTYITAYSGSCGALTQIGSSTSCFNTGTLIIDAAANTTYYLNIRSSSSSGYTEFDICVFGEQPPPPNDACAAAINIDNGDVLNGNSTFATNVEDLTPCSGGDIGSSCASGVNDGTIDFGAGLWYLYNSSGNESITIQVGGFDTEVQVFEGTCGALTCVAGDDDSGTGGNNSQVCFDALVAADYYIYVDGHNTNTGAFTISLNTDSPLPPANDDCDDAENIPDTSVTVNGTNAGATDSAPGDACVTGNDVWYSFTTDANGGDITVTIDSGFEYAIYTDCAGTLADACNTGLTGAPADTTYYLRIGDDGSPSTRAEGTFSFSLAGSALSTSDFDTETGFTYYPNPVKNTLTLNAQQNIDTVTMYNMLGQEVLRLSPNSVNVTVNMANLSTGAYFAKVSILGNTQTVRIIKQ
ncbi:hypothetical protein BTO05_00215 [Winogradskyella sp. PC-19]|uniref:T9SS type A sorting domain-containing protein n=1 Tax=unclassified Winogradskyella TaxID=2615021 RepID=UPI000B3CB5C6|nr:MULTISPECIES: T9SS type A sorting domain-containing protein [unclassified Winogradskyella]ARV08138.1 hypothetical protein BTO05_00215 [Winogradskyella sp. PC-19]